ncbi:MAG TPA: tyrosine--tRNA ligase [Candidatus Saccharimonadales bacterium]|nr:tyrosine--tRNA ligase [Candidatus Saccharimonadales bacterium]
MMTLSEELTWRGFVNQTTFKDLNALDGDPISFYFGVDPSADSMTIGNLAAAMMVRHFIDHGHKAFLLVGGATGMIGDPDGKAQERDLKPLEEIARNKAGISEQYRKVFAGKDFEIVDNYDWFKDMGYLNFLRDIGKHVPMRQMLGRDFVQSRLGEDGSGISYAEFSYSLIQGYDFLHLYREHGVTLQVCGADQWGNSITGVDLIRRIEGVETHVYSVPLVVNKTTGVKFGKTEDGAVWLDPEKTSPSQFYQFWINCDDAGVEDYLKIYTLLDKEKIDQLMSDHRANPKMRIAQTVLAQEVTRLVHGENEMNFAESVRDYLTGESPIGQALAALDEIRKQIPAVNTAENGSIVDALVSSGLASSNTEARRFLQENAVSINGQKVNRENFEAGDFQNGRLLLRRGKAFKDSALVELQG